MCDICMKSPCALGCPNAPEPTAVYTCAHCGNGIYSGDEYIELDGKHFHGDCIDDMSPRDVLRNCGYEILIAEEDVGW